MSNPENNWVHLSLKAANGALLDVRAEDGDTLRALVDGATEAGVYDAAVAGFAADASSQAVETVKRGFGKTTEVKQGGFGSKAATQSQPERVELGEHDGYTITLNTKGKFGPYINAYNRDTKDKINANLPKGLGVDQVDKDKAIEILSEAA